MKILVCDDDREIARAIEIYLNNEGFEVVKAHDGFEALNVVKSEDVKLAIMDVMMPKLDGIQATQMIRNEKDRRDEMHFSQDFAASVIAISGIVGLLAGIAIELASII